MDIEKVELVEFALKGIDIEIKECENDLKIINKNLQDFIRGDAINPTFNKLEAEKKIRKLIDRLEYLVDDRNKMKNEKILKARK